MCNSGASMWPVEVESPSAEITQTKKKKKISFDCAFVIAFQIDYRKLKGLVYNFLKKNIVRIYRLKTKFETFWMQEKAFYSSRKSELSKQILES
jgi:hypothetical protein